ncbi:MAG: Na/Pi symporter [Acidobacteriota bacterium]
MVPAAQRNSASSSQPAWRTILRVLFLLFVFLVGVRGLGTGFKELGGDLLKHFFTATSNPFIGLIIGILGTTLVQSSSVSTSLIVALVAAPENPLPVADAIPMIMGANIGTTVTNTIVSLGHIGQPEEFRRAFAAATCHDFFNFIAVAVLLPLELTTGYLRHLSGELSSLLAGQAGTKFPNPLKDTTNLVLQPLHQLLQWLVGSQRVAAILLIMLSVAAIFGMLYLLVRTLRTLMATRMESYLTRSLGFSPHLGIIVGVVVTVMVQSSSITTSVLVPLAGAGLVSLYQVFPITLGANIGTTITALLASLAAPPETAAVAIQVALAHLLFNISGILLMYPLPAARAVPIRLAEWLARIAVGSRRYALFYVFGLFYGLPALLIVLSRL